MTKLTSLVVQCACLVGGFDWMQAGVKDIRLQFHSETLGAYINDLEAGASPMSGGGENQTTR